MSDLQARFDAAVDKVRNAPGDGAFKPSQDFQLKMYGLYRQATDGDVQGKKPGMLKPVARFKWEAWSKNKGMTAEGAMQQYVEEVDNIERDYG